MSRNKWRRLPQLKAINRIHAAALLQSMKAFYFSGNRGASKNMESIASLEIGSETEWKELPVKDEIATTHHIAAVPFQHKIILFGQYRAGYFNIKSFTEEGELL